MFLIDIAPLSSMLVFALILDRLLGEPRRLHPLVGFGFVAAWLESVFNSIESRNFVSASKLRGFFAWAVLCIPLPFLLSEVLVNASALVSVIASSAVLYLCVAPKSLAQHAVAVEKSLKVNNLNSARAEVAKMVSRDCNCLQSDGVASAAIESVLENGSDGVIAPMFWFCILGAPGAVFYRLANTLDAMWGYKTKRFLHFGFVAAKLDDLLNWIPARCSAFLYALSGSFVKSIGCWQQQGSRWPSPNACPVMASGAGALSIEIGGAATYHGQLELRPKLGIGETAKLVDISRSVALVNRATGLFVLFVFIWELSQWYLGTVAI